MRKRPPGSGRMPFCAPSTLSIQLPFTVVPLLLLTSRGRVMGHYRNRRAVALLAGLIAAILVGLNGLLLYQTFGGKF